MTDGQRLKLIRTTMFVVLLERGFSLRLIAAAFDMSEAGVRWAARRLRSKT